MKYAAIVEYDGSAYSGWQRQSHAPSLQARVEEAVSAVADHALSVQCAGRTDAGVHALGQVIHFETHAERPLRSWLLGINSNLPSNIAVKKVTPVPEDFHARFSATARSYRYIINNEPVRSAILANRAVWEFQPLDVAKMSQASRFLIGRHDFTSYRALACQAKSAVREVTHFEVVRQGQLILLDITANAFLHHMVRNIAGVLISIGKGEHEPEWANEVLQRKDRSCGGVTAPAEGLYLVSVHYASHYQI